MNSEFMEICKDEEFDRKEFELAFKQLRMKKKENKITQLCNIEKDNEPISMANRKIQINKETKVSSFFS